MPRISGDSLHHHREQVHRRIFEAFASLMGEHAFEAISMAQIAERAGLGRTAIYHHFPDTEAVVVAFATHETTRYVERLRSDLDRADDPVERLRTYVQLHLEAGEQFHMGLGPALYGLLSPASRGAIREHVVAVEDVLRGVLEEGRATGAFVLDDVDAAMMLVHACLGQRQLAPVAVAGFVLRAVGAGDADRSAVG